MIEGEELVPERAERSIEEAHTDWLNQAKARWAAEPSRLNWKWWGEALEARPISATEAKEHIEWALGLTGPLAKTTLGLILVAAREFPRGVEQLACEVACAARGTGKGRARDRAIRSLLCEASCIRSPSFVAAVALAMCCPETQRIRRGEAVFRDMAGFRETCDYENEAADLIPEHEPPEPRPIGRIVEPQTYIDRWEVEMGIPPEARDCFTLFPAELEVERKKVRELGIAAYEAALARALWHLDLDSSGSDMGPPAPRALQASPPTVWTR